jgi:hypothetical protein
MRAATAAVGSMIAVMFMGSTLVTPLYSLYAKQFGFSPIMLTLIYAVYVIGNLVSFAVTLAMLALGALAASLRMPAVRIP